MSAMQTVDGRAIDQELLWYRIYLKYLKHLRTNENAYGEESMANLFMSKDCGSLNERALARENVQLVLRTQFYHQGLSKNGAQSWSYNNRWLNTAESKTEKIANVQSGCEVSNARAVDKFFYTICLNQAAES